MNPRILLSIVKFIGEYNKQIWKLEFCIGLLMLLNDNP